MIRGKPPPPVPSVLAGKAPPKALDSPPEPPRTFSMDVELRRCRSSALVGLVVAPPCMPPRLNSWYLRIRLRQAAIQFEYRRLCARQSSRQASNSFSGFGMPSARAASFIEGRRVRVSGQHLSLIEMFSSLLSLLLFSFSEVAS